MLSKRVIVVASDKPFQKRLVAGAMAAGGAVQAFTSCEDLPARIECDLVLYALGWSIPDPQYTSLLARLPDGAWMVPILPAPQLAGMVALLAHPRVSTVLVAEEMDPQSISQAVSKRLYGDLFGLEKVMPWGVRLYSMLVGDYQEKSQAIAAIGDFAQAMGVRRKYREQIDQCIDEMLMNALYDAPVGEDGKPLFADVPVRERVGLKVNEKAMVQYACDGERFAVSVRDAFGSLGKKTVLAYLEKCLHASGAEQIDRKAGGAGLGLYLIANSATEITFHIFSGTATEVVCCFNLSSARSQLRAFGVFEESVETATRPHSGGPARTVPSLRGRRREDLTPPPPRASPLLPVMMTFAVLLLIVAVTLTALPYLHHPARAALMIETDPPGATVFVDGRKRGTAPLTVDGLTAGTSYAVRATLAGHKDDDELVTAADGKSAVKLKLASSAGVVEVDSNPPGAQVLVGGQDSGKLTPTELTLPSGQAQAVVLRKQGFLDESLDVRGPQPGERTVYRARLPLSTEVAALTITAAPPGATVSVDGMALMPPAPSYDTFVRPKGMHHIKISLPGYIDFRADVSLAGGEHKTVSATLREGGVLALNTNVKARVLIDDKAVGTAPLPPLALAEGVHTLSLRAQKPFLRYQTKVTIEKGKTLTEEIPFGTVEIKAPGVAAIVKGGAPEGVTELYLPLGPQKLDLVKDGVHKARDLVVTAGGTTVIDAW